MALLIGCACVACDGTDPATVELCGGYAEGVHSTESWGGGSHDLVFVVDSRLRARLSPAIADAVEMIVTGDSDRDGRQDQYARPSLRVAVINLEDAAPLAATLECRTQLEGTCPPTELPVATYEYYPYGFEDDLDAFTQSVRCVAAGEADCAMRDDDERYPFASGWTEIVVLTDQDLCAADNSECADSPLRAMIELELDGRAPMKLRVIGALPTDLVGEPTWGGSSEERDQLFARLLADNRLGEGAEPFDCAGEQVIAAREIVRALSARNYYGIIGSLCSEDVSAQIYQVFSYCGGAVDGDRFGGLSTYPPHPPRVDANGFAECEVLETLPLEGRITRCDQLNDFGRSLKSTDADGRETCSMQQLLVEGGAPPAGYGFYYIDGPWTDRSEEPAREDFTPACFGIGGISGPHIERTAQTPWIPGSSVTVRCALEYADGGACE